MHGRMGTIKRGAVVLCELFAVFTVVLMIAQKKQDSQILLAIGSLFLILLPWLMEALFRCRVSLPVYLFALFYSMGPMLGHCYDFYYTVPYWDKFLHLVGGVMFALLGLFLFEKYAGPQGRRLFVAAAFGFCFSVTVSVFWEFFEYGSDALLGMDMQSDSLVMAINSYLLSDSMGGAASIEGIEEVVVNGMPLPVKGYIDLGLIDTMRDMLIETVGAALTSAFYARRKGAFRVIAPLYGQAAAE